MLDQGDVGAFASRRARSVAGHLAFADAEPPSGERGLEVGDGLFEPGRGRSLPAGHAARFPVMGIPISTVSPPITTPTILSTMKAGPSLAAVSLTDSRSDERRVGEEGVGTCKHRGSPSI